MAFNFLAALAWFVLVHLTKASLQSNTTRCRYIPGDPGWPDQDAWNKLNATVGGRLIATVPLASPCHPPNYDAQRCAELRQQWPMPHVQYVLQSRCHGAAVSVSVGNNLLFDVLTLATPSISSPSSFIHGYFANGTCSPFSNTTSNQNGNLTDNHTGSLASETCPLGNLVVYSINAAGATDIAAGIKFAREHNIRLVIKNTGHE